MKTFITACMALATLVLTSVTAEAQQGVRILTKGSRGPEVAELQKNIGARVDGIFEAETSAKLKAWQAKNGLEADGDYGLLSRAVMEKRQRPIVRLFNPSTKTVEERRVTPVEPARFAESKVKMPWTKKSEEPKKVTVTKASRFGYKDRLDNGRGSPYLAPSINQRTCTNNSSVMGVALPVEVICKRFGVPAPPLRKHYSSRKDWWEACKRVHAAWEPVRKARIKILCPSSGRALVNQPVKILDVGPGLGPQSKGVGIDFTYALSKKAKTGGMGRVAYQIIKAG